jgi:hypothetical protein
MELNEDRAGAILQILAPGTKGHLTPKGPVRLGNLKRRLSRSSHQIAKIIVEL